MIKKYYEPLTRMDIDDTNLDKWKTKLKYVSIIPNNLLKNMDIIENTNNINKKRELYSGRIETFIKNKTPQLLENLIKINKSRRDLDERKEEYNNIINKYNKSIKYFKDKYDKEVVIKLVINNKKDKLMAYLQYYNYKKNTKDIYNKESIIKDVDDFILKYKLYGLYIDELLIGFLIIEKTRNFKIDGYDNKVPTFYIQEVYIDKNYRGRKLAKLLLEYAILLCPINKNYISLMTYEGNNMVKIAQSCNFILQENISDCPINKLLLIRNMEESDFSKNSIRLSLSKN